MWRCRPEERTSPVQHPPGAPAIVWLRDDLRIADNPALNAAVERGGTVLVLFVLDEVSDGIRRRLGIGGLVHE